MAHSHLLSLLCYTLLSLLGLSHAFPHPQAISSPQATPSLPAILLPPPVVPLGGTIGTFVPDSSDNATNTISPTTVVDGVDLADFVFNPLQMPTQPGPSATQVVKAFLTGPSAGPNDALTSRSISDYITVHAFAGSTTSQNGTTVYSTAVNVTAMAQMLQDATAYALGQFNTGNFLGTESDNNYYRFTSQGLTIAAIAYGEAGSGPQPFNWGDFSIITGALTNFTNEDPTNNMTWNGYVTMDDGTRGVDFFVVPSFGDVEAAAPAPPAPAPPAPAAASPTASHLPGGTDGDLRRAKRAYQVVLGVQDIRMTVRLATTQILNGVMYTLCHTALTTLVADSGQSPTYTELVSGFSQDYLNQAFPDAVMQIVTTAGQPLSRDVIVAALNFLIEATSNDSQNGGRVNTLYGELTSFGNTIARWSLGSRITGPPCAVQNPDGSYAIGCFLRYG